VRRNRESLSGQQDRASLIRETSIKAISSTKEPIKITWSNLNYIVKVPASKEEAERTGSKTKPLQVLKDCSGYALPGQTLFIMGASGAGKTSLMNALSDRINVSNGSKLTGNITINDQVECTQKVFGSYGTYVMQDDVLFAFFTVKEALTFAGRLRLKVSEEEQDRKIAQLIHDLGLEKCQNTICGSTQKKTISGGERKRTSIGVELITDPSIILLDEPTSGLDSFMAKSICKLLQKLAHT
jgi:ABC-type multidrug transport system ATPase subunit